MGWPRECGRGQKADQLEREQVAGSSGLVEAQKAGQLSREWQNGVDQRSRKTRT